MRLRYKILSTIIISLACFGLVIGVIPTSPAYADKKAERLDYLPLNTNSFRVRPAASTLSAPHVVWDYVKQSDGSSTSSATQTFTVTGALATDIAFVTAGELPTNAVYIKAAVMTADTLTVTLSGAPGSIVSFNIEIKRTTT